jgi:hypothetical protein
MLIPRQLLKIPRFSLPLKALYEYIYFNVIIYDKVSSITEDYFFFLNKYHLVCN